MHRRSRAERPTAKAAGSGDRPVAAFAPCEAWLLRWSTRLDTAIMILLSRSSLHGALMEIRRMIASDASQEGYLRSSTYAGAAGTAVRARRCFFMRALVVHNPKAGKGMPSADELLRDLQSVGLSLSYCNSNDAAFPDCLREPVDLVIAAGGDGTVTKLIRKLPYRSVPIGILPVGTANNIARSLGVAGTPRELAAGWSLDHTRRLDIGKACGKWGHSDFVEAVGVGSLTDAIQEVDAAAVESGAPMLHGRAALAKRLADAQPTKTRLKLDGRELSGDLLLVEIMNIKSVGPGLKLAPDADPGDGLLDVVCLRTDQRKAMTEWLRSPDHKSAPLAVERSREVEIAWRATPLRVDDQVLAEKNGKRKATVRVEEHVNVLVSST